MTQGAQGIRRYIHTMAREAGEVAAFEAVVHCLTTKQYTVCPPHMCIGEALVKAWGTELLDHASLFGPMVLVALPEGVARERGPHSYHHAEAVQNTLYHQFHIEARNM